MKKITSLLIFLIACISYSQENVFDGKVLNLKNGGIVEINTDLRLGKGTKDNGYFRYIEVNAGSMMRAYNTNGTNWGVQDANAMSSNYNDLKGKVIRIEERGNKRTGKKFYAIIGVGETRRYQVDIENALISGEIYVEGNTLRVNAENESLEVKTISKADELLKLKVLKEEGIIDEDEFNKMKAEILNK